MRLFEVNQELSELASGGATGNTTGPIANTPANALAKGQQLKVDKQDGNETTLVDKNTGVKTVVPNDPNKPGMITTDQTGKAYLNAKPQGKVQAVKPGQTVTVR